MLKNCLVAVVGPTGSGKTALATEIAKKFNGVIISADSRQVYRGLNAGTNKEGVPCRYHGLTARCVDGVPQLLVDVTGDGTNFTLSDWLSKARAALATIWNKKQLPVVTGGTGLYVTALLEGYVPGLGRYAKRKQPADFASLTITPKVSRRLLLERAIRRVEKNFDLVIEEVKGLLAGGVDRSWIERIGLDYSAALKYYDGSLDRTQALSIAKTANKAFIRRQLTWWRHHGNVHQITSLGAAEKLITVFINQNHCNQKEKR